MPVLYFSSPLRLRHHHGPHRFGLGIQPAWCLAAMCMERDHGDATALATLILLTPCSYSLTANQRPGNTPVHSLCRASLMQVVLYSIATKDNLHYTSVFSLTISAGLTSLCHQQQWLPLKTRTVLVKATAGAVCALRMHPVVCYNQALMFVFQKQWCLLWICIGYISDHISYMSHIYLVPLG